MSRAFISCLGPAVAVAIIIATPASAHVFAGEAAGQPPATQGTKGSVAAGDAADAATIAAEKTGAALEKSGSAIGQVAGTTRDAVVSGAKKTMAAVARLPEKIDETWITAKVAGKINADDALEDVDVDVKVKKNVVTITGDVPSQALHARVLTIARSTEGVALVVDRMTVRQSTP